MIVDESTCIDNRPDFESFEVELVKLAENF